MKKILFLLTVVAMVASTSCNMSYEKTKSGLKYKIVKGSGKDSLKVGDIVKFHICFDIPSKKDTVLQSTFGKIPAFTKVDTGVQYNYSFLEVLPLCTVDDSLIISMSVDSLKSLGVVREYNDVFKKGGQLRCRVKILKRYATEMEAVADRDNEIKLEGERETAAIEKYLKEKNIKAVKTAKGAYVEITAAGDMTLKADSGKVAKVMYKGYLQNDHKKVFDTNMDSTKGHTEPIDVHVGKGGVIPAWEDALPYFGKGTKGKIYVPAMLGYPDGTPDGAIPAFSNLIFDVEVLDVTNAPVAATPAPAMK